MTTHYVMDACALLAAFKNEEGAHVVKEILTNARNGTAKITMHSLNLLEVYYGFYRALDQEEAAKMLNAAEQLPMTINPKITTEMLKEAGRLKATYKVSLADSIALAQAAVLGAKLLTADHHELDIVEQKEPIKFLWVR
ncbi:MAG: PIN domain-containing protein [Turicibacter sp.]|nr:PIN domain-containing protein [Turicibacter sp.]